MMRKDFCGIPEALQRPSCCEDPGSNVVYLCLFLLRNKWLKKFYRHILKEVTEAQPFKFQGSNNNPYKEGGAVRAGRQLQEVADSDSRTSMGTLSALDPNRMTNHQHHVETNRQPSSWAGLNKSILPPPKKRHHHVTTPPHTVQPSRVIYMECKENKGDRGGSLTSRISTLSPGTKRKMLGYAADGSIPPLPPRQKRIKRVSKQGKGDLNLSTKYTRLVEPSGLLGDLKPGIMREQMRTRRHIHALLGAVIGEVQQKDYYLSSVPAIDSSSCETDTSEFPVHLEEQPQHHNSNHEYSSPQTQETMENLKEETINPGLHPEVCDTTPERPCGVLQGKADSHDEHVDILTDMRKHTGLLGVLKTNDNRASGFVRFQRDGGQHTCNPQQHSPIPPTEPLKNNWTEISTGQRLNVPLLVDLKQEPDFASTSGRESCLDELIHCKQEDMEEDDSKYAFDFSSACGDVASCVRHVNDAVLLHPQDSRFLVSVAAANVATCWLELLSLDVKGRLAALKRSKRRVSSVILSGELDLDVPLLPCTFGGGITRSCAPSAINQADGGPQMDSWRRVFESMDRALALEGDKLESWLQQIHVMQAECRRDMTMSLSAGPPSFSEPMPRRPKDVQHALPASTDTFASPIGDTLRT